MLLINRKKEKEPGRMGLLSVAELPEEGGFLRTEGGREEARYLCKIPNSIGHLLHWSLIGH